MKKRARDINIGDTVKFEVVTAIEITPRGKYVFKSERCYQSGGIMGAGINPEQWVSLNNFEFLDALEGTEISKGGYDEEYNSYLYRIFEHKGKFYKFEYVNGEMYKSYEVKKTSWMEYKCDWVEV